jgi:hypothetical protein
VHMINDSDLICRCIWHLLENSATNNLITSLVRSSCWCTVNVISMTKSMKSAGSRVFSPSCGDPSSTRAELCSKLSIDPEWETNWCEWERNDQRRVYCPSHSEGIRREADCQCACARHPDAKNKSFIAVTNARVRPANQFKADRAKRQLKRFKERLRCIRANAGRITNAIEAILGTTIWHLVVSVLTCNECRQIKYHSLAASLFEMLMRISFKSSRLAKKTRKMGKTLD